ncbi:hypothetical protein ON010_g11785 [Phytophthora cinnamomi]|nr:hypothetical protein ON010_g11785 [Phytophthora cinnamomi]
MVCDRAVRRLCQSCIGAKGVEESVLKAQPNYKYIKRFRYKAEGRILDYWFEEGYSAQRIWSHYNLENVPEAQLATNANSKTYYRYVEKYDSAIYNHKNNIFESPIYYDGTPGELNVKVRLWAKKPRPKWYVEEMLELDRATQMDDPLYKKFLELRRKKN